MEQLSKERQQLTDTATVSIPLSRERERERGEHSRQEEEQYCSKVNGGARAHHVQHGKLSIALKVL